MHRHIPGNAALWHPHAPTLRDCDASYKIATGKDWDPLAVFAEAVRELRVSEIVRDFRSFLPSHDDQVKPCAKPS